MSDVFSEFRLIQNDFRQTVDVEIDERRHEKFLDLYFDALATYGSMNLLLADAMDNQTMTDQRICSKTTYLLHDMESRYDESFNYEGDFSLQRILDESAFGSWRDKSIWIRIEEFQDMWNNRWTYTVHDQYRGDEINLADSFTCSFCTHNTKMTSSSGYCEIESNGTHLPEFDNWVGNPAVVCEHCQLWAANQNAIRKEQIDKAGENFQKMIDGIQEIRVKHDCPPEIAY